MGLIGIYSPFARETPRYDASARTVFYGPRPVRSLAPASDDSFHVWREGDRLALIANRAWGTPRLWWLVCDLNGIVDPLAIEVDTRLRLPSRARVEMEILG